MPVLRHNDISVEPGWVSTKTGDPEVTDDLAKGPVTQAWLASSHSKEATVSGGYFTINKRGFLITWLRTRKYGKFFWMLVKEQPA